VTHPDVDAMFENNYYVQIKGFAEKFYASKRMRPEQTSIKLSA
jgi:hypothetical protein